jgi:hypothetical protein
MGFIKKKEDFVCKVCGKKVVGTGYTNHCPNCLYSRHVDQDTPGDRKSACKGLMKPVKVEVKGDNYTIIHKCKLCSKETRNRSSDKDNYSSLIIRVNVQDFNLKFDSF